ncbi:MAG TPA: hypothetical protein P5556_03010 [Candidatus Gastranaerophilales bacterium]|nr:hypothetical protein [Candidatus Gastranaerophilales bacterium]
MGFKYTISELAETLSVSRTTIEKKIRKMGIETVVKHVNNRAVKAVELTSKQLNEFGIEISNETIETHNETSFVSQNSQLDQGEIVNKILEYSKGYNDRIESYIERALKAELQQKLIEDSENRKDKELIRLNAELKQVLEQSKQLKRENEELKQKINKKWWKIRVI